MEMNSRRILSALQEVLEQGICLLDGLDSQTYSEKMPVAYNASIGAHYRHCLDHFTCLLASLASAEINYDCRARDLRLETNPELALIETRRLLELSRTLENSIVALPLQVRCKVSYHHEESPVVPSTFGREVMYSVAHAVHHYALIGVICGLQGRALPQGFGVAPSTLNHQKAA
jgi:hypothetical protein